MNYEEKKAWLWRYRDAQKLLEQLCCRLEEARTAARHTTQNFSPTPSGSGDGQSLARAVERTDDLEHQVSFQLAECDALYEEIDDALQQLEQELGGAGQDPLNELMRRACREQREAVGSARQQRSDELDDEVDNAQKAADKAAADRQEFERNPRYW